MPHLRLEDVTKRFRGPEGPITAVNDIDLAVEDGEFLVLVGPSGCGKTTTLRMIAGLEKPDDGAIWIDDKNITQSEPNNRDIAMVFQNYALYPHKTVRGNIRYGLEKSTSLSNEEIESRVIDIAELMDITDHLDKKPGQLSGGQKQRAATGRALVRDPDVFLLDEPLSNLDAKLRLHMRTEIQRIQADFATTTVYVTHDQEEAMTMGDQIAVMKAGELQQVGTPAEIYDFPQNRFVAEFVGNPSMNFFEMNLSERHLEGERFGLDLPTHWESVPEDDYIVGVRPEQFSLDQSEGGNQAKVSVIEPIGSEAIVYLTINDNDVTVKMPRERAPEEGNIVSIEIPTAALYLFDRETGELVYHQGSITEERAEMIE